MMIIAFQKLNQKLKMRKTLFFIYKYKKIQKNTKKYIKKTKKYIKIH